MRVLAVNCGSSTLKVQIIETDAGLRVGDGQRLASGTVDRIGGRAEIELRAQNGARESATAVVADHAQALTCVLDGFGRSGVADPRGVDAVGHRVVHGGDQFAAPVLIDDRVVAVIESLVELAPLHNGPSLRAIRAARAILGTGVPMVATFDTVFHRSMPERASQYAIPYELATKHRIQRYGFHGLAHRYMVERYAVATRRPVDQSRLITLQLGNGCSATAVLAGRSVDTSMGFTPLEGLVMGTRSGDVDPSLAAFLAAREGVAVEEAENWLNRRSGLLGLSGRSQDMRELLEAETGGDSRAALAVELFCYRVRKYIGAYLAVLGGADAVLFGGGIGQNAAVVRARICAGMDWCGLSLDPVRNVRPTESEMQISAESATMHAYVIPVDEEALIADDTVRCLS